MRQMFIVFAVVMAMASCFGRANAQIVVGDSNVGYIDSAVLSDQMRVRFDAAYSSRFADRAEFVYAQYAVAGAPLLERGIDNHQELSAYLEWQPLCNFSFFTEVPFRWIDPVVNQNTGGLYDIQAGVKAALIKHEQTFLTAQLRGYFPTGDADSGLSTDHVSLEPALLGLFKSSSRTTVETELRYWIPIDGSTAPPIAPSTAPRDFAGEILRYGIGLGHRTYQSEQVDVSTVVELVGWHVFSGLRSDSTGQRNSATNDHITNLKLGLRLSMKPCGQSCRSPNSLFLGYGTVLTDDNWYSDIVRLEFRHAF